MKRPNKNKNVGAKTQMGYAPAKVEAAKPETAEAAKVEAASPVDEPASVSSSAEITAVRVSESLPETAATVVAAPSVASTQSVAEEEIGQLRDEADRAGRAARSEAARLREEAEAERRTAQEEAAQSRNEIEAMRREAEQQAAEIRADADRYHEETEKRLERAQADLVEQTRQGHEAIERELVRVREEALAEAMQRRDELLGDPREAIERGREELATALDRVNAVAASLSNLPRKEREVAAVTAPLPQLATTVRTTTLPESTESEAGGAMAAGGESRQAIDYRFTPPPPPPARGPSPFILAALLGVAVLAVVSLQQIVSLRDTVDQQGLLLTTLAARHEAVAEPKAAVAPTPAPEKIAAAPAAAVEPAAVPPPSAAAPPTGAAIPSVAVPKPAPEVVAVGPLTDEETASLTKLLEGRKPSAWQKRRLISYARFALRGAKLDESHYADINYTVNKHEPPAFTRAEFEDLKKISRAQHLLVKCKLSEGGVDLELGASTVTKLRDIAAGKLACKSTKEEDVAALTALQSDLARPDWTAYLDETHAATIAKAALTGH